MQLITLLTASAALFGTTLALPKGGGGGGGGRTTTTPAAAANGNKPVGGPASATVTIYPPSNGFTCSNPQTPPDNSAGKPSKQVTVTEDVCTIVDIPAGSIVTSSMIATPKARTLGCYLQFFKEQGCGITLSNTYFGFPYDGVVVGSAVGCAAPPIQGYGAVQIVCA